MVLFFYACVCSFLKWEKFRLFETCMDMTQTIKFKQWIAYNFIGWFLGAVFIIVLSGVLDSIGIENMQFYLGIGMGAGVSFMQWILLRKHFNIGFQWISSAIIGMGLCFIVFDLIPSSVLVHKLPFSMLSGSLLTGILQNRYLGHDKRKNIWILLSVLAWCLATLSAFAVDYTQHLHAPIWFRFVLNLSLILSGGLVMGMVTGRYWSQRV